MTEVNFERQMGSWAGSAGLACGLLFLFAGSAAAYTTYTTTGTDNCAACHGDFRDSPYTSLSDGVSWGDDLHDVHRGDMLSSDCGTCHLGGFSPVFLGISDGGLGGLPAISCAGCHGRAEDGTGNGSEGYSAGLRQHHWNNGITGCGAGGCHVDDANPANFTPVGEDIMPPYYSDADASHPTMPSDPCNPATAYPEDYAATTLGLDNDGDNLYDEADLIDCPEPGETLMLGVGIGILLLAGRLRGARR